MLYITDSNNAAPTQEIQMRYELNIGLDPANGRDTQASRAVRAGNVVKMLGFVFGTHVKAQIIGDFAAAEEPCIYVEGWVPSYFGKKSLEERVARIAAYAQQDCIAIAYAKGGALAGPNAAAWGEFNPEYFRRPAVAVAA